MLVDAPLRVRFDRFGQVAVGRTSEVAGGEGDEEEDEVPWDRWAGGEQVAEDEGPADEGEEDVDLDLGLVREDVLDCGVEVDCALDWVLETEAVRKFVDYQ
jgi:hypothetical protein